MWTVTTLLVHGVVTGAISQAPLFRSHSGCEADHSRQCLQMPENNDDILYLYNKMIVKSAGFPHHPRVKHEVTPIFRPSFAYPSFQDYPVMAGQRPAELGSDKIGETPHSWKGDLNVTTWSPEGTLLVARSVTSLFIGSGNWAIGLRLEMCALF